MTRHWCIQSWESTTKTECIKSFQWSEICNIKWTFETAEQENKVSTRRFVLSVIPENQKEEQKQNGNVWRDTV